MGFLASAEAAVLRGLAAAMVPPPPPDITRWCEENIVFDERSPIPGPASTSTPSSEHTATPWAWSR